MRRRDVFTNVCQRVIPLNSSQQDVSIVGRMSVEIDRSRDDEADDVVVVVAWQNIHCHCCQLVSSIVLRNLLHLLFVKTLRLTSSS